jgi:hypothetical protein
MTERRKKRPRDYLRAIAQGVWTDLIRMKARAKATKDP